MTDNWQMTPRHLWSPPTQMMRRPCIEVPMEVDEERFFLMVVESSPGGIQQRRYVQRGKPRPIIGGLR